MGIDVNRGYDIREFQFPLTEEHLAVLRASLARHLILWCVLAPLAEKAGSGDRHGTPDPEVAATAIDMVLFGTEQQVEAYVAESVRPYELQSLIAHGGDPALIGEGRLFRALQGRVRSGPTGSGSESTGPTKRGCAGRPPGPARPSPAEVRQRTHHPQQRTRCL